MRDLRASDHLLAVIADEATAIVQAPDRAAGHAAKIVEAAIELRRRGDTLVRREDLLLVTGAADHGRKYGTGGDTDYTGFGAALGRIERAMGL